MHCCARQQVQCTSLAHHASVPTAPTSQPGAAWRRSAPAAGRHLRRAKGLLSHAPSRRVAGSSDAAAHAHPASMQRCQTTADTWPRGRADTARRRGHSQLALVNLSVDDFHHGLSAISIRWRMRSKGAVCKATEEKRVDLARICDLPLGMIMAVPMVLQSHQRLKCNLYPHKSSC
eukprot:350255-Chlamydomonas_euryale.AAC.10